MDLDGKHCVSVAAAIVDGDRVLVTRRRDNGKWEPPGGTLEPTETILEGLRREVREEIGIDVVDPRMSGVYKNMSRGIVALVFRCGNDGAEGRPSEEVAEIKWMNAEEIENTLDPAYACRLLDALENSRHPVIRSHDGENLL